MAGQFPRPWFRMGSITRPAPAPAPAAPEPRPAVIRPPNIIRPSEPITPHSPPSPPSIPTLPRPTAASVSSSPAVAKVSRAPSSSPASPEKKAALPSPSTKPVLPLPLSKLTSPPAISPAPAKVSGAPSLSLTSPEKKAVSPSPSTKPVLPSPSAGAGAGSVNSSPSSKLASPAISPALKSTLLSTSDVKPRNSVPSSPTSTAFIADVKPTVTSPYKSPKPKSAASPPSPLVLPPSQLQSGGEPKHTEIPEEIERKTVVVKKTVDKTPESDHFASYHGHKPGTGQNRKQELHKMDDQGKQKGSHGKKVSGLEETKNRFITIAGENRGAFMEVILSDKNKTYQVGQKKNENENESVLNNPNEKSQKAKRESRASLLKKAFVNSNVQGINNSILLDSSFTHHDPGIHLVFSRKAPAHSEEDDEQQS